MTWSCLERDVFARLCGDASHEVGCDECPQHDWVLAGRQVWEKITVKVDRNQHDGHLAQLQYTTYSTNTHIINSTLWRPLLPYGYSYKASRARLGYSCTHMYMATVGVKGLIADMKLSSKIINTTSPSNSIWPHLSYGLVRSKREYYHNCSLVALLCRFLWLHTHLSSLQVLSTRFGFISLGSLTVLRLLCVC